MIIYDYHHLKHPACFLFEVCYCICFLKVGSFFHSGGLNLEMSCSDGAKLRGDGESVSSFIDIFGWKEYVLKCC